jgi:hypothetical protein
MSGGWRSRLFLPRGGRHCRFGGGLPGVSRGHGERTAGRAATIEARERFAGAWGAVAKGLVNDDPLLACPGGRGDPAQPVGNAGYDARAAMIAARKLLARGDPFVPGSPFRPATRSPSR